jgi:hypothetical protein
MWVGNEEDKMPEGRREEKWRQEEKMGRGENGHYAKIKVVRKNFITPSIIILNEELNHVVCHMHFRTTLCMYATAPYHKIIYCLQT